MISLSPSGESASPPVQMLQARVGGEGAGEGHEEDVCLTVMFDKYTKLQHRTFSFFKQDRDNFLLHFHLDSHDRCDVKLKPLLWDQGAYFKPSLLTDGALRLIPHFLPISFREDASLKRPLSPAALAEAPALTPAPQRRKIELIGTFRPSTMAEQNAHDSVTAQEEQFAEREAFELARAAPMVAKSDGKIIRGILNHLPQQDSHLSNPRVDRRGIIYDHGIFVPRSLNPLPKDVTLASWNIDFAAAKQRYADKRFGGVVPTVNGPKLKTAHRTGHREMIEGKYGMVALKPCSCCVEAGERCRVYHSECYEWPVEGGNMKTQLGWRCSRCRSVDCRVLGPGGCNAQFQA